jgi:hypothetical protein
MSRVLGADYVVLTDLEQDELAGKVAALEAEEAWLVERRAKKKKGKKGRGRGRRPPPQRRTIDLRPHVKTMRLLGADETVAEVTVEGAALVLSTVTIESRGAKPRELLDLLGLDAGRCQVVRLDTRMVPLQPPAAEVAPVQPSA